MVASFREITFILCFLFLLTSVSQLKAQADSSVSKPLKSIEISYDSVVYKTAHYKPRFIANLQGKIKETSGLLFSDGLLWTMNDSGNLPEIYSIDSTNGRILRTVVICNVVNTDWESITQDDSNVFIGDFGNNAGSRTDLRILKITKTDLLNPLNDTVEAGIINFYYPDQTNFSSAINKNNFDCEAFFIQNDSLHLFSKNWLDLQTKHYVLSASPGNYVARFAGSFNTDGLITDASINEEGNIVLLGYKNTKGRRYACFAWLLSGYKGSEYFSGIKRRLELGSALHLGQTEGIVLRNDNTGWLSSESILDGRLLRPAKIFRFDFRNFYGSDKTSGSGE